MHTEKLYGDYKETHVLEPDQLRDNWLVLIFSYPKSCRAVV